MNMKRNAGIAMGVLALVAAGANAGRSVDRYTRTYYDIAFTGPTAQVVNGPASGLFEDFSNEVSYWEGNSGGSANAYQISNLGGGVYSAYLDVRADAQGNGSGFAFMGAQSRYSVDFSLGTATEYTMSGWAIAFGMINGEHSESVIQLINLDTSAVTTFAFSDDDYVQFDLAGTLAAGNYRLYADATAWVDRTFGTGFGDANASSEFVFTLIPAPSGALALLVCGGMVGVRRRR